MPWYPPHRSSHSFKLRDSISPDTKISSLVPGRCGCFPVTSSHYMYCHQYNQKVCNLAVFGRSTSKGQGCQGIDSCRKRLESQVRRLKRQDSQPIYLDCWTRWIPQHVQARLDLDHISFLRQETQQPQTEQARNAMLLNASQMLFEQLIAWSKGDQAWFRNQNKQFFPGPAAQFGCSTFQPPSHCAGTGVLLRRPLCRIGRGASKNGPHLHINLFCKNYIFSNTMDMFSCEGWCLESHWLFFHQSP